MAIRRLYRRDHRRHRVRRPPPKDGFLVRELARLAGVSVPTVKRYVRHGLLAPVPFRGTATRYPHDYLVRVLALRYWRADGHRTLAALRRRLDSATFAEMETWIFSHPLPAETAAALRNTTGIAHDGVADTGAQPTPLGASASSSANSLEGLDASLQLPTEGWQRWTLVPGLELHLQGDAAPMTRQLAAQLFRAFASFVSPQTE